MTEENYYLAIDGGGTKTKFLLADSQGVPVAELALGPTNPVNIGVEESKRIFREGITQICENIELKNITLFAGMAGGITGNNQKVFNEFFGTFGFKKYGNSSDAYNSLALGLGKEDGIMLIMGTGIMGFAVKDGRERRVAGWGTLFDSGGCGYTLGRDAIYAALCQSDGTGEKTVLTPLIEEKMGKSVPDNLGYIYQQGKDYIASFSRCVTEAVQMGDKVAQCILERNMKRVSEIINSAAAYVESDNIKVALTGGLIVRNHQFLDIIKQGLDSKYNFDIRIIDEQPIYGALKIAKEL